MKSKWLKWSKIALLLVCIGFFMPVSCNGNGIDLTRMFWSMEAKQYAVFMILVLVAALLSIIFSLFFKEKLDEEPLVVDWALLCACIGGGVLSLGRICINYSFQFLQIGAFVIIVGWILSLIFLILASGEKKDKSP